MKVLLVSYFFPPYNVIGAVRVGKLAEYWLSQGHDVRVISAKNQPLMRTLPTKFPAQYVSFTDWVNVNALPQCVLGGRDNVAKKGFVTDKSFISRLGNLYKTVFNFPDGQIGWYPFAVREGKKIIESGWEPDFIYASAHPLTSLIVANKLALKFNVPWVAEYRDLWTDNAYYQFPGWRKWVEKKIEKHVLTSASVAVTVSEPLAQTLRDSLSIPVATILNGFDPDDYHHLVEKRLFDNDKLNIVYTGMVYAGKQDPSALFEAVKLMKKHASRVRVYFYGRYASEVERLADSYGVRQSIVISDMVSYEQSIQIQMQADLLLLLLWNDPRELGVYTGKLFEYFGARHPIVAVGLDAGVAAKLIKERGAGFVSNNPAEIAQKLDQLMDAKLNDKDVFTIPEDASIGLTRTDQFAKLDIFLREHGLIETDYKRVNK